MKFKIIFFASWFFACAMYCQSPLAYYDFTGATGTDISGNGNTGTVYGTSTVGNTLVIGSNITDYFVMPASLLNNRLAFSVSFKINFTGFNTSGNFPTNHILSGDNPGLEGAVALSYQKNVNLWRFALNGNLYDFFDNSILVNQWYCVVITRDGLGAIRLYIDNVQHQSVYSDNSLTNITSLLLGQETDCTGGCFDATQCTYGMIDDFKIYSAAIGQAVINTNCNVACVAPADPVNMTSPAGLSVCANTSATLTAAGSGTLQWFFSNVSPAIAGTGSNFITPVLSPGTYTFYVGAFTCTQSISRTAIEVTVLAPPTLSVSRGSICIGQTYTISYTGASTYTVSGGSPVVSPTITTSYTITGVNASGCQNTAVTTITVSAIPSLTLSGPPIVCLGATNNLLVFGALTYTWNTGSNQPFVVMSPTTNTTYSVVGANGPGCADTAIFSVTVDRCDGLNDYSLNFGSHIKIYPNPAISQVNIETGINSNFELINNLSQTVLTGSLSEGINCLNLHGLPGGIYTLKMDASGISTSGKIVKVD